MGAILEFVSEVLLGAAWEAVSPKPAPGMCPRCRKAPAAVHVRGVAANVLVCQRCASLIARNHRAGLFFFLGLALLMVVLGVVMATHGLRQGGPVP